MPGSSSPTADAIAPAHAPAGPSPQVGLGRRLLLNAVALALIYGNAVVALQPPALQRAGFRLPTPRWVRDAFLMSGMFTSYSHYNVDLFVAGLRTDRGEPATRGQWLPIAVREHFPNRHGVTFTKLFAMHHWDVHGRAAQRRAWKELARQIRERHNRLHPEREVSRVRFGSIEWRQSPLGFRANKKPGFTTSRTWYEERP